MSKYVTLALVKTDKGDVIPVELPFASCYSIEIGDIVFLPDNYTESQGSVICTASAGPDDDLWTFTMLGTGLSIVRAKGYARIKSCEWEDEKNETVAG